MRKMYMIMALGLLFGAFTAVDAQPKRTSEAFVNAVSIAYYSPFVLKDGNPSVALEGLKVGFEHLLNSGRQSRTNDKGQLRRSKTEYLFTSNLGYYGKKEYQHGVFINVETGARYIFGPGIIIEGFIGIGAMKRFVGNRPKESFFTEDFGVAPIAALGLGVDFKTIANVPVYMRLKGGALGMYPTEQKQIMPALEISFVYLFSQLRF